MDYRAHEVVLAEACNAIEREAHGVSLAALDIDEARLRINGEVHHRVGRHATGYKTRVGEIEVERTLHRCSGERNERAVNAV